MSPMPRRQRGDSDAQARRRRGANAKMPKNQRNNFEASAWRCRGAIAAPSAPHLDVAGRSCLSWLPSAQRVF
jgi:hypothetical protein